MIQQFVEITSPLQEITCCMGSHSVTCHPAEMTFPPLAQPKLVLDLTTPEGCKAELTWWWLHPEIAYLPKTVTYLRNNQAVSSPGLEPVTRKLHFQRPNQYTTETPAVTVAVHTYMSTAVCFS